MLPDLRYMAAKATRQRIVYIELKALASLIDGDLLTMRAHVYTRGCPLRRWIALQGEVGRRYCPMCACHFLPFLLDESIRFCLCFSRARLASWKGEMPIKLVVQSGH